MKRVRIDFAGQGVGGMLFHAPRGAWAVALAAIALLAPLAVESRHYLARLREHEAQLAAFRARANAPPLMKMAARQPQLNMAQAAAINEVVLQLNLPWRDLKEAMEAATPSSVALLALEPDAKKRIVRITAEARSSDDMVGYIAQLKRQEWFSAVVLAHHEINEQDRNRPIRFQLDAQWRQAQ